MASQTRRQLLTAGGHTVAMLVAGCNGDGTTIDTLSDDITRPIGSNESVSEIYLFWNVTLSTDAAAGEYTSSITVTDAIDGKRLTRQSPTRSKAGRLKRTFWSCSNRWNPTIPDSDAVRSLSGDSSRSRRASAGH
ncbi:hypothetical protein HSR122_1643 [Halapricum desulfuricans]|uniref:Uncharacterized protein n=2 Tax=Halapricum desulfuricans TaxID=2841257 RepID=A0A897N969_9EURY|nr:hypothetical protein HSR122_1643 [Halapricum desulfuricans]